MFSFANLIGLSNARLNGFGVTPHYNRMNWVTTGANEEILCGDGGYAIVANCNAHRPTASRARAGPANSPKGGGAQPY